MLFRSLAGEQLNSGMFPGEALDTAKLLAPLPRAYEWVDASAYLNHVRLVRKARGASLPPNMMLEPLVYQGGSGVLLGARSPIPLPDTEWGLDFEGEIALVVRHRLRRASTGEALAGILGVTCACDVSARDLQKRDGSFSGAK